MLTDSYLPIKFIISLAIGAAIGLEREYHESEKTNDQDSHLGVRDFSLITLLGTISGYLALSFQSFFILICTAFFLLLLIYYYLNSKAKKDIGITTEIAVIFSFLLGFLIAVNLFPIQLTLALAIVLMLILSKKENIKSFVTLVSKNELNAFISYAIVALVILPFLPNRGFALSNIPQLLDFLKAYNLDLSRFVNVELINPFNVWQIVALITGVDIIGYILTKSVGKTKGWVITSLVGGFVSSTATTQAIARKSKTGRNIDAFTGAAIIANLSHFLQIFILIAPINSEFLIKSTPILVSMTLTVLISGLIFLTISKKTTQTEDVLNDQQEQKIFSLAPALKFALLFMSIKIATKFALALFGNSGFYITSAVAAITGVDALTINTAELSGKTLTYSAGLLTFILINAVNLSSKTVYTFIYGNRSVAIRFGITMLLTILAGITSFYLFRV